MQKAATKIRILTITIVSLAVVMALTISAQAQDGTRATFPDVPRGHWAEEAIYALSESGLIEGLPSGNYGGDKVMTRNEFIIVLGRLHGCRLPAMTPELMKDLEEHAQEMKEKGLVKP